MSMKLAGYLLFLCGSCLIPTFGQTSTPQLWLMFGGIPGSASDLTSDEAIIDQGFSYGYTGVVLTNGTWTVVGSPIYSGLNLTYATQFVSYIQSKGMKVTVGVTPFGWADDALVNNPNWAEGEHITGSQFTVNPSKTALVPVNSFGGIANGGFEAGTTGWSTTPNQPSIGIDTTVSHSGSASGYVRNVTGTAQFSQVLNVIPWRQYHVRMFLKTSNFSGDAEISVTDPASNTTCFLYYVQMLTTQDWIELDFTFNSRGATQPVLSFGSVGGCTGTMWFDDVFGEETSLVYVLRRSGTPLKVYDPLNPGTVFVEGTDFKTITDSNIATGARFPFVDYYHTPTTVTLPSTTSLQPGQTVAIDYYAVQPIVLFQGDVGMCLTDPDAQAWMKQNVQSVAALLPPGIEFLLGYGEQRHMNSCSSCKAKNMTPGQLLAWHVNTTASSYQAMLPSTSFWTWSDMFDPYHNAINNYWYVEGDLAGSWTGLPSNLTILDWDLSNLKNSLTWFSGLNPLQPTHFNQIIAGYYDSGNGAASAAQEMQQATGIPGLVGLMYYTGGDYSQAQAFAATVKSNWNAYLASVVSTVTPQITINQSVVTLNRSTGLYSQTVKLNNTGAALPAAAYVMDGLPSGVAVLHPSGVTSAALPAGSPYVEAGPIGAGATATVTLQFTRTGTPPITYTPRVLGSGPR